MQNTVSNNAAKVIEKSRTYYYPNEFRRGELMSTTFLNVVKVEKLPSGGHRVYTADGGRHFASNGFIKCDIVQAKKEGSK